MWDNTKIIIGSADKKKIVSQLDNSHHFPLLNKDNVILKLLLSNTIKVLNVKEIVILRCICCVSGKCIYINLYQP